MASNYNEEMNIAINCLTNNVPKAYELFKNLVINYPNSAYCYYYLGIIEAGYYKSTKKAIDLMTKAVELVPFYEAYKALTEYHLTEQNLPSVLKYAKQTLIYNSQCAETLSLLKRLFPNETYFIKENGVALNGEYQYSKDCPQRKYHKMYDAGTLERKPPKYLEELLSDNQKILLKAAIEQSNCNDYGEGFVVKIPDGRAFIKQSDQTYIISSDNKILKDMLVDGCPELSIESMPNEVRVADKLLVLSSCWGGNFYHWLTWVVPRLCMVEHAGYKLKDFDKIAINYLGFGFQRSLLESLGIPKHKIIGTIPYGAVLRAKVLVTASLPSYLLTPQIVTDSLREKFLKPEYFDDSLPKRIYLSRNKSSSRFVLNEDEVYLYLQKFGFVVIYAEDHTFEEQVKIFANADIVIAPHGAGLVNLSFCKPNTKVIEIYNEMQKDCVDTSYFRICDNVRLDHYFMFGNPDAKVNPLNMNIDIDKLSKTMNLANIDSLAVNIKSSAQQVR